MKASKFTDALKGFVIKQVEEGMQAAETCRRARISHLPQSKNQPGDQ